MKPKLLQYLACPSCAGALGVVGGLAAETEIVDGALQCVGCSATYPIVRGIPRFAPASGTSLGAVTERTRRTYTFTWRRFGERAVAAAWEKDSYRYSDLIPPELTSGPGRVGLDAGCGAGHDLIRVAEGGAEVIGFDLSDGVEVAQRLAAGRTNVHLVQGDLNRLPFRPAVFDFVYSFGVLHHLPRPERAFQGLAATLKPGAPLVTYLYEDFGDRSGLERGLIAAVRGVRAITSRLPTRLLYALCCAAAPVVWALCSLPARLLAPVAPRLAARIPFRHTSRWNVLASDLFDRFAPPLEWRYSRDGVRALYGVGGFERTEIRQYRGWVSWGWRSAPALAERRA